MPEQVVLPLVFALIVVMLLIQLKADVGTVAYHYYKNIIAISGSFGESRRATWMSYDRERLHYEK